MKPSMYNECENSTRESFLTRIEGRLGEGNEPDFIMRPSLAFEFAARLSVCVFTGPPENLLHILFPFPCMGSFSLIQAVQILLVAGSLNSVGLCHWFDMIGWKLRKLSMAVDNVRTTSPTIPLLSSSHH